MQDGFIHHCSQREWARTVHATYSDGIILSWKYVPAYLIAELAVHKIEPPCRPRAKRAHDCIMEDATAEGSPHLGARDNVDAVDSSEDGSCQLGPEGIPHAVFDLRRCAILARWGLHRYKLFAVHSLRGWLVKAKHQVSMLLQTRPHVFAF